MKNCDHSINWGFFVGGCIGDIGYQKGECVRCSKRFTRSATEQVLHEDFLALMRQLILEMEFEKS